jgi:hypothetical protein
VNPQYKKIIDSNIISNNNNEKNFIWVCTAHLDNNDSGNVNRRMQLSEISEEFKGTDKVIFGGNTSIPKWQSIDLPFGWFDAWRENGKTSNETNSDSDRFYRIWYKGFRCIEYETIPILFEDVYTGRSSIIATFE